MNKYQVALDELSKPLDDSSCGGCKCGTSDCQDCKKAQAVFTLQELVEKATPKKPTIKRRFYQEVYTVKYGECPNCLFEYVSNEVNAYCPSCGQALDWS